MDGFYETVGISPFLPLSILPFSYIYFICILPEIRIFYGIIIPKVYFSLGNFIS